MTILTTTNEAWGFYGTIGNAADPKAAWPAAFRAVRKATGSNNEAVRAFLDSRKGRHFADDVLNGLHDGLSMTKAVAAAVERWMGWRITRSDQKDHGIPAGLPYLTGWVAQMEVEAGLV